MRIRDDFGKVHEVISENESGYITPEGFIHRTKCFPLYWCRSAQAWVTVPEDEVTA
jgi:hypothetical protein